MITYFILYLSSTTLEFLFWMNNLIFWIWWIGGISLLSGSLYILSIQPHFGFSQFSLISRFLLKFGPMDLYYLPTQPNLLNMVILSIQPHFAFSLFNLILGSVYLTSFLGFYFDQKKPNLLNNYVNFFY